MIDGDAGLEQELEKLEQNEEELQETPEDGIIDDDAPPPPTEEGEENTEGGGNELILKFWQKLCKIHIYLFFDRSD